MQRFTNVAVVIDPDATAHAALDHALPWVRRNDAALGLVCCVSEPNRLTRWLRPAHLEAYEASLVALQGRLEELADPIRGEGRTVSTSVLRGGLAVETTREVLRRGHDLVVKAAAPEEGIGDRMLGTDDMRLLRKCPCPVWIVHDKDPLVIRRVLATIDPAPGGRAANPLPSKIIELASALAKEAEAELLVGHAWSLYGESLLRGRGGVSDEEVAKLARDARARAERNVRVLLESFPDDQARGAAVHLRKGEAGLVIPELVAGEAIDLLVMGTIVRTGIPGLLMGNTAERILTRIQCPVLTVKPEGFVTPVTLEDADAG